MQAIRNVLRVELRRSVCSGTFLLQIGLLFVWMCLNCTEELSSEHGRQGVFVLKLLSTALTNLRVFSHLLLILGTVSYSWSYCSDLSCGFGKEVVRRVGIFPYGISKIAAVAVSSFAATAAAIALFVAFALLKGFSWDSPNAMLYTGAYLRIASDGSSLGYLACRCLVSGATCSLAAIACLCFSAYLRNIYVSMLIPALLYFAAEILVRAGRFSPMTVMFGQVYPDAPLRSLGWAMLYLTCLAMLFGRAFLARMKKEYRP